MIAMICRVCHGCWRQNGCRLALAHDPALFDTPLREGQTEVLSPGLGFRVYRDS
ncbi:hypothetical protein [Cupriavidus sp. MP-37]|uniref:hypothetical protein n=1 Tax=Cupriavidus sp. MP-37 TaxID=2884455 RepID=UPI001D0A04F9|nr:hypothetical protein [Cupriavidus sp. MP-37]UDM51257.1 hypothetical protein LIN44_05540 [Cupriavidus sp. MP-37]